MRYRDSLGEKLIAPASRRGVAWAMALALLVNIFTIMPIMLRMAVAEDSTVAAGCPIHDMGQKGELGRHPVDHGRCLVCTGGIGAAMLAANFAPLGPTLVAMVPAQELPALFPSRGVRTAYISRAPPILA